MNYSARRINLLAAKLTARKYLEIGVDHGLTFADVEIADRTAVDPRFMFDRGPLSNQHTQFHEVPSDKFFSELEISSKFDLIFIDGLHQFEQVARDLSNSVIHSHSRTVIMLDDTKPNDIYSAIPNVREAMKFRRLRGNNDVSWHGDVFKIVFHIHDFWPALNYKTIIGSGNPQTLVWQSNSFSRNPRFDSFETISRLTYFNLLDNIDLFRECEESVAIDAVISELDGRDAGQVSRRPS